ncbi:MAG: hypothetical protein U9R14_04205 [Patescibacteria group bacterium]|nr:hypothetical protein [Patescibacteria group bacterium]
MEILSVIKGFVTNSSSANYWLDDGVLEDEELEKFVKEINQAQINNKQKNVKEINQGQQIIKQNQVLEETVIDFSIWLLFSLILIIVFFLRKLKKI